MRVIGHPAATIVAAFVLFAAAAMSSGVPTVRGHAPLPDPVDQREVRAAAVQTNADVLIERARTLTQRTIVDLGDFAGALDVCSVEYCVASINSELDQLQQQLEQMLAGLEVCAPTSCTVGIGDLVATAQRTLGDNTGPPRVCSLEYCAQIIQDAINDVMPDITLCTSVQCAETTVQLLEDSAAAAVGCSPAECARWILAAVPDPVQSLPCSADGCVGWLEARLNESLPEVSGCVTVSCIQDALPKVEELLADSAPPCGTSGCIAALEEKIRDAGVVTPTCDDGYCVDALTGVVSGLVPALGVCGEDCTDEYVDRVVADVFDQVGSYSVCLTLCDEPLRPVADMGLGMYRLYDQMKANVRRSACSTVRAEVLRAQIAADAAYAATMSQVTSTENLVAASPFDGTGTRVPRVTGHVRTEDGGPATGFVVLSLGFAPYVVGAVGHPVLETALLDSNGAFRLDPLLPPDVLDAAEEGNGIVHGNISYIGDTHSAYSSFPMQLVDPPDAAAYLVPLQQPRWNDPLTIGLRPGVFGVYCTDRGDPSPTGDPESGEPTGGNSGGGATGDPEPQAQAASSPPARCLATHENHYHYRQTIVGEVHAAADMKATFSYGHKRHHDSTISAMHSVGGVWEAGGFTELRQETGWEARTTFGENTARFMRMKTAWSHEGDYRWNRGSKQGQSCNANEQAYVHHLTGEMTDESIPHDEGGGSDNRCKQYDQEHRLKVLPRYTYKRAKGEAQVKGNAGTWMEVGYTSRSGFSDDVWIEWSAGSRMDRYWLCGTGPSGFTNWLRVFAGPSERPVKRTALGVAAAALCVAGACGGDDRAASETKTYGGPLEMPIWRAGGGGTVITGRVDVGSRVYAGMGVVFNYGSRPATIERVSLVKPSRNVRLDAAYAADHRRDALAATGGEWPPDPRDFPPQIVRRAGGTIVPPKGNRRGDMGIELLPVFAIPRKGRYTFRAIRVDYRVDDRRYWVVVPYSHAVCTFTKGECPDREPYWHPR